MSVCLCQKISITARMIFNLNGIDLGPGKVFYFLGGFWLPPPPLFSLLKMINMVGWRRVVKQYCPIPESSLAFPYDIKKVLGS